MMEGLLGTKSSLITMSDYNENLIRYLESCAPVLPSSREPNLELLREKFVKMNCPQMVEWVDKMIAQKKQQTEPNGNDAA